MHRALRFLAAGGTAALVNFGSRFAFSAVLPFEWAVAAAYGVGMLVAFLLMRGCVFAPGSGSLGRQVGVFALVNALALLQTLAVSSVLARWLLPAWGVGEPAAAAVAHAVGVAVPVLTSYFGHRHGTFR